MNDTPTNPDQSNGSDMLRSIFTLQEELNDYVLKKNGLTDKGGSIVTMGSIRSAVGSGALGVNDLPNQWLVRYAKAMGAELEELQADLLWKWWSKDSIDLQNIRVELIDILHFLISAMISAGLTADKVHDIYKQKHAANRARQDAGYNKDTKTEADNRAIA